MEKHTPPSEQVGNQHTFLCPTSSAHIPCQLLLQAELVADWLVL